MMTKYDRTLLSAIASADPPYAIPILRKLNESKRWWQIGWSIGGLYVRLMRLENSGHIRSEWSAETFPERGNRRRRYYFLTYAGATEPTP